MMRNRTREVRRTQRGRHRYFVAPLVDAIFSVTVRSLSLFIPIATRSPKSLPPLPA